MIVNSGFGDDAPAFAKIKVKKEFANQAQLIFEFLQLTCKPQVNALLPDPRKGITAVLLEFIKELELPKIALGVFAEESNDTYTRLMAMKFFKSLLYLAHKNKEILHSIFRLNPIEKCLPLVSSCQTKLKTLNMLHSCMFEFINLFGVAVYDQMGEEAHTNIVEQHADDFLWCQGLVDKFLMPDLKAKK